MERKSTRHRGTGRGGFALVLALSMMAFVVMLLLSMTLLVQVESTNSSRALTQLRAKESARLALMMALGDLQRHAGPDQRVTARAEILGSGANAGNKMWTGVWDTTDPSAEPKWLISGQNIEASQSLSDPIVLQRGNDVNIDGKYNERGEFAPAAVGKVEVEPNREEIAWWVSDEGTKAPIKVNTGIEVELEALPEDSPYLDYEGQSKRIIPVIHDPNFDYDEIIDITQADDEEFNNILKIQSAESIGLVIDSTNASLATEVSAELRNSITPANAFVLSNPSDGGLKKDLSYLKTLDSSSSSQTDLDNLYADVDGLLNPAAIDLINFRGNPTAFPSDEILGMQLSLPTVQATEELESHFSLAPVITEFQFSAGVAADSEGATLDTTTDTSAYIVYKVYLELWNPYTIPFRIGDTSLTNDLGYSDIRVEIRNLPSFTITNDDEPANTIQGTLGDISVKWSDSPAGKTLRPGMVYLQTVPIDSFNNNKGAFVDPLTTIPTSITGTRRQSYTGSFTFSEPLEITVYGINSNLSEHEILTANISYPDYEVIYDGDNSATRFKRDLSIQGGSTGITLASIEQPGYAFGFHFKLLDEQEYPGTISDLSDLLSKYDIRKRSLEVDLAEWDINEAWSRDPPLPYDFDSSALGYDPSEFDPSESFQEDDFFYYRTLPGGGRKDRIARFIDLPTSEITDVGIFRSLKFKDYNANSVGSSWGGVLNRLYDRYFFSTLPDPASTTWDGIQPLANSRISAFGEPPALNSPNTSTSLILKNGFNLNSTSALAWEKVLRGKSFNSDDFEIRYEQNADDFTKAPLWKTAGDDLRNVFFNHPQSAIFNLDEQESNSRYSFITRENTDDYIEAFSIDNTDWINDRQYPSFRQPVREIPDEDIEALSDAIKKKIIAFGESNNRPIFSIEEFISEDIFTNAINEVPTINNRIGAIDLIPPYSPSHISSMTLMNTVSKYAFVRSDTFKIVAYSRIKDSITENTSAEVLCEAIVQRTPTSHSNPDFEREFKILDIKWRSLDQ